MPSALFHTLNTIGIREDLSNVLTQVSPEETPFLSAIGKTQARNTLHEWQTASLAAAASNAAVEGASATPVSGNATARLSNRTQIFTKAVRISGTDLAVDVAGRANDWALQLELKAKELARDCEHDLMVMTAAVAGDTTAETARVLEGLGSVVIPAGGTTAFGGWCSGNLESTLTTGSDVGTRKNLTETRFNNLLNTIWTAGGSPNQVYAPGYLKRVISSFTSNNTRFLSVSPTDGIRLNANVVVYQSDFGDVRITLERNVAATSIAVIPLDMFKLAELRPLQFKKLDSGGDREFGFYVMEATLACYAPTHCGMGAGLASAEGATT